MFVSSFSIRHFLNDIIIQRLNKQLLIQSIIRYQSQLNIDQSFNANEQKLGLFKHFHINEQTQQRLKG
jgi:hypothetical protein